MQEKILVKVSNLFLRVLQLLSISYIKNYLLLLYFLIISKISALLNISRQRNIKITFFLSKSLINKNFIIIYYFIFIYIANPNLYHNYFNSFDQ